jgi:hypothetical protein
MVETTRHRRFRLSIRAMMIAIALCALLLSPLVWMFRHLEALRLERIHADLARAEAEAQRALYVAQVRSAQSAFSATKGSNTVQPKAGSLWAALSINHLVFKVGQTKDLRIEFSLINDGDKVIDPKIAESRIVVNGKELAESESVLSGVPKDAPFKAMSPGDSFQFSLLLRDHLKEPGTYRISWKGAGFQSSEIVLRILPENAR